MRLHSLQVKLHLLMQSMLMHCTYKTYLFIEKPKMRSMCVHDSLWLPHSYSIFDVEREIRKTKIKPFKCFNRLRCAKNTWKAFFSCSWSFIAFYESSSSWNFFFFEIENEKKYIWSWRLWFVKQNFKETFILLLLCLDVFIPRTD